jgi:hypothetical protein
MVVSVQDGSGTTFDGFGTIDEEAFTTIVDN